MCDKIFVYNCIGSYSAMKKRKMLMYVHYYYPDVASTAQIYTDLCNGLKDDFDITVICTVPSYKGNIANEYKTKKYYYENINGINVIRVRVPEFSKKKKISRVKNIMSYFINSMLATLKVGRQDIVFTASQPPILGGLLGIWGKARTKGKLVYNIQDFNPEQTMAVHYMGSAFTHKIMMLLDKYSCRKSDLVITVGRDMKATLEKRFNNTNVPNNTVINNWIDENEVYPLDKNNAKIQEFKKKYNIDNKFVIMYSGNIGLYYDLLNIIKQFSKHKDCNDVVLAMVGEGAIKDTLVDYVNENGIKNIVFIPYQDKKDLVYSINAADVHLVTNAKGIKGVSVPSKIYGVMAANVPIIGILEENSEAWKIIDDSKCGLLAHAGDYKEIDDVLNEVIQQKEDFVNKYLTGRDYLVQRYTKNNSIQLYKEEIINLLKK